jgi:hypothetical protein
LWNPGKASSPSSSSLPSSSPPSWQTKDFSTKKFSGQLFLIPEKNAEHGLLDSSLFSFFFFFFCTFMCTFQKVLVLYCGSRKLFKMLIR